MRTIPLRPINFSSLAALVAIIISLGCNSDTAVNHIYLARKLHDQGDFKGAIAEYNVALKIDPMQADARLGIGQVHESQEDFAKALEQYQAVLKDKPNHVIAHLYMGNAYRRLGDNAQAIRFVLKASELSPGEGWIRHLLGKLYLDANQYDEVEKHFRKATELSPNEFEFMFDLAKILEKNGKPAEALTQYQAALKIVEGLPKYKAEMQELGQKIAQLEGK